MQEIIEILPVSLLDQERRRVTELRRLASSLRLEFGWHYLLDLTWILSQLETIQGKRVLDAGAGVGIVQWYLARQGAEVISVDRESRTNLSPRFRLRFHIEGLREQDLLPARHQIWNWSSQALPNLLSTGDGKVVIYNQDLLNLVDIADESIDFVVAVSALEHNPPEDLVRVVSELMRVLKPGGVLLATLGAAKDRDWFHQASKGWCFTDHTLKKAFKLSPDTPSNYGHYDELFHELRDCSELRDNLAGFYSRSGDNGMPWGIWDPLYQPVGVCKIKH